MESHSADLRRFNGGQLDTFSLSYSELTSSEASSTCGAIRNSSMQFTVVFVMELGMACSVTNLQYLTKHGLQDMNQS